MTKRFHTTAKPLGDLVGPLVAPHCRRRGVANLALMLQPEDLFGARFARGAEVERMVWPREGEVGATLVVAAQGATALALQHTAAQVVERANLIIGWPAVARLKITQARHVRPRQPPAPPIASDDPAVAARVAQAVGPIADENLKAALTRLGTKVAQRGLSAARKIP